MDMKGDLQEYLETLMRKKRFTWYKLTYCLLSHCNLWSGNFFNFLVAFTSSDRPLWSIRAVWFGATKCRSLRRLVKYLVNIEVLYWCTSAQWYSKQNAGRNKGRTYCRWYWDRREGWDRSPLRSSGSACFANIQHEHPRPDDPRTLPAHSNKDNTVNIMSVI